MILIFGVANFQDEYGLKKKKNYLNRNKKYT